MQRAETTVDSPVASKQQSDDSLPFLLKSIATQSVLTKCTSWSANIQIQRTVHSIYSWDRSINDALKTGSKFFLGISVCILCPRFFEKKKIS